MTHLIRVPIGKLGKVITGKTPPSSVAGEFGSRIPFITPSDLGTADKFPETERSLSEQGADRLKKILIPSKSVCVVCIGATIGKVGFTTWKSCTNQQINSVVVNVKEYSPEFIYYLFITLRPWLQNYAGGAATPIVNKSAFSSIEVPIPKFIDEQQKIAAILTAYDDLIENNRQRIALLEKMAEEIYREWFVRLRFPGHEHTPLHNGVPEGWEAISLLELCRLKRGYDLPKQSVEPGPYPILGSTGISGWHNEYKSKAPVVTTGRSGSLGEVVWSDIPAWPLNTSLYVADPHGNSLNFIYYTLRSANLAQFNSGAGVPTLNRNHLSCIRMVKPCREAQSNFDELINPIREQVKALQASSQVLAKTRDLLLNRLISGKLRVDDLDIQFPPSMANDAESAGAIADTAPACV